MRPALHHPESLQSSGHPLARTTLSDLLKQTKQCLPCPLLRAWLGSAKLWKESEFALKWGLLEAQPPPWQEVIAQSRTRMHGQIGTQSNRACFRPHSSREEVHRTAPGSCAVRPGPSPPGAPLSSANREENQAKERHPSKCPTVNTSGWILPQLSCPGACVCGAYPSASSNPARRTHGDQAPHVHPGHQDCI